MRLIDADALKKEVDNFQNCYNGWSDTYDKAYIIDAIEEAPTIELKRGEWQYVYKGQWVFRRCSCCEWTQTYDDSKYMGYRYNFCPNCGADMREREGE